MATRVATGSSLRRLTSAASAHGLVFRNHNTHCLSTAPSFDNPFHGKFSQQSQFSKLRKETSLANLFLRYGFPPSQFHDFLSKNHFLLNYNLKELRKSLDTLLSFKIPQKSIISLICDCPGVLEYQFLKKWAVGLAELRDLTTSPLIIRSFLQYSKGFQLDSVELSKSVEILRGFGFTNASISRVLEEFPSVLLMNNREIQCTIEFLVEFGIPRDEIDRVIRLYPRTIGLGVEDRLKPLLCELRDLGFSDDEVRKEVLMDPRILGMEVGEFSRCLQLLRTLKCRVPIKEKVFGCGVLRAGFEVKLRVDCLCNHGLTRREAFKVLWKEPRLIMYDIENIEKKIEFLVQQMKYSVDCLPDVPEYLGVNFEKQIVPRHNVIEYLKGKGAIDFQLGLKDLIKPSRVKFYNLYVKPYPECEKIYGRFSRNLEVKKSKHPPGLWKVFRPQKFPETKEDVKNIKSFMENLPRGP
ncbi:hypothetical protein L6164_011264 [Bauhinia variegata]|uniref:Uncharacterized protein n=1 Tax=Bauhinia variegata TaxID=167791 RepID=A0ACB9P7P7_BAUVA|nr:hypothetical protein L6164_011264 [Bauhinia variegata]